MMNNVEKKLKHLKKHFNFKKDELLEIKKMYSNDFFNPNDESYLKLLQISKNLCETYTKICLEERKTWRKNKHLKSSIFTYLKFYFKKNHILKLLMPIHGMILYSEENLNLFIGQVDCKGYGYINRNVTFTPTNLVSIEKGNVFAFDIEIGSDKLKIENNLAKLGKITFDKKSWIGAGCKLGDNITVGKESVLGCGATLISDLKEKSLAVGRPAKIIRNIEKSGTKHKTIFTETQMNMIYNHIKNLNYGKFPKEFDNMLNCNDFNTMAGSLKYLFRLTKVLCDELNEDISDKRRNEIYDILFIKPKNIKIKIGKNLHVDMLGTIIINGDIIIGDNVSLGGNIVIEGNTVINSGSILHASGHSLLAKERLMSFSLKKGFYENSIYGCIFIGKGCNVGENVIVAPNSFINSDIPNNKLFVKDKIITE